MSKKSTGRNQIRAPCHQPRDSHNNSMKLYVQRIACSADGNIVYALSETDKRLMKSTDAGKKWALIQDPCTIGSFACAADGQNIYAIQRGGWQKILVSRDGGQSFTDIETPFRFSRIELSNKRDVLYGLDSGNFHESKDGGATWTPSKKKYPSGSDIGFVNPHPQDMIASSDSGEIVYKATGTEYHAPNDRTSTLLRSTDSGRSWTELDPSFEEAPEVWIRVPGQMPDPRVAEMEAKRKKFRLKEPLGWYSNEAREILDRQDIQDGGVPGVDFGNGPGKP